jgi:hypothetical protein
VLATVDFGTPITHANLCAVGTVTLQVSPGYMSCAHQHSLLRSCWLSSLLNLLKAVHLKLQPAGPSHVLQVSPGYMSLLRQHGLLQQLLSSLLTQLEVVRMDDAAPIPLTELAQVMAACYKPLLLYRAVSASTFIDSSVEIT